MVFHYQKLQSKDDHHYSNDGLGKEAFGHEDESWQKAIKGYNAEPRSGKPVFYVMSKQVTGSEPLKMYYSYWPDDTILTVGSNSPVNVGVGRNYYKFIRIIGYVFSSEAAAQDFRENDEDIFPIYHYKLHNTIKM